MAVKRRASSKNPPIVSHEFVIQNHADIVACMAMVFVVGLMFQATAPWASVFIAVHHNVTVPAARAPPGSFSNAAGEVMMYSPGPKDAAAVFFYALIAVVMHQIVQEYLLDKINRKLHLSKVKHAKFNESGQLLCFCLVSLVWAADIVFRENLLSVKLLWEGYPHSELTFMLKFFFIVQMSYWIHIYPELYFQKVKKEEMAPRIRYATCHLLFIGAAYVFSYTRLALFLLVLHYAVEALFHASRLLTYADKLAVSEPAFKVHDGLFVLARLGSITVTVLTFWYGMALVPAEQQVIDSAKGNYNSFAFRVAALAAVCFLQAGLMWNFITFQLKSKREKSSTTVSATTYPKTRSKTTQQDKAAKRKEKNANKKDESDDVSELPEVDQNTKKALRQRK